MPDVTTLTYVITDNEVKYTLEPKYSVTPDFCPFEITVNVNGIDVTFDPDTQEIVVEQITDDLTPSNPNDDGSTEHTYDIETTIEVTAEDGSTTTDGTTIPVVVKNPCVDSDYISLELPASLADLTYTINSGSESYDPIATGEDAKFVKTVPSEHTLCGNVRYTILADKVVNDGIVIVFDENTLEFTASNSRQ